MSWNSKVHENEHRHDDGFIGQPQDGHFTIFALGTITTDWLHERLEQAGKFSKLTLSILRRHNTFDLTLVWQVN